MGVPLLERAAPVPAGAGALRRALPAVAALAAGVAVLVLAFVLLGRGGPDTLPGLEGRPVAATGAIEPRAHLFGDQVDARVDAVVDRGGVDPAALRLQADFTPYEPVGPVRVERRDVGGLTRLRFTLPLRCLGADCVPPTARRVFEFRTGALVGADGEPAAQVEWPEVEVTSRITQSGLVDQDAIIQVHWRANMTELPPVSYRVRPALAAAGLAGAAAALAAAAAALLVLAVRRPPRQGPPLPPLERAFVLLEAARRGGDAGEQRRALDLVAAELARSGEGDLARAASALAWSRPRPDPDETASLRDQVADLVAHGRNGSGP